MTRKFISSNKIFSCLNKDSYVLNNFSAFDLRLNQSKVIAFPLLEFISIGKNETALLDQV